MTYCTALSRKLKERNSLDISFIIDEDDVAWFCSLSVTGKNLVLSALFHPLFLYQSASSVTFTPSDFSVPWNKSLDFANSLSGACLHNFLVSE